ncbi:MAG: GNAT family N-acetyltransferase [Bacteroidia bacterium]
MNYQFRKAEISESFAIWQILEQAIKRRKEDGSNQWQDGYPNMANVRNDIEKGEGFVLVEGKTIISYCAILINNEPEYANIIGKWLTDEDFVVFHRLAVADKFVGKGFAKKTINHIEKFALKNNIYSIKADTNFDNLAMLKIFQQLDYCYCGEVYFRGSPRKAFEKILK